jgi:hypothetical protein
MSLVYIKFANRPDEAQGVDELSKIGRIYGYRGGVWAVSPEHVARLKELELPFRAATEDEVDAALGSVRHPAAAVLQ